MHVIAAKAVALKEALQPEFRDYQRQVLSNARAMAARLAQNGYQIVSGGTDNHLFLMSLADRNITGKDADAALGRANITVNKNAVPNDPRPPMVTSGLRIGTRTSSPRCWTRKGRRRRSSACAPGYSSSAGASPSTAPERTAPVTAACTAPSAATSRPR